MTGAVGFLIDERVVFSRLGPGGPRTVASHPMPDCAGVSGDGDGRRFACWSTAPSGGKPNRVTVLELEGDEPASVRVVAAFDLVETGVGLACATWRGDRLYLGGATKTRPAVLSWHAATPDLAPTIAELPPGFKGCERMIDALVVDGGQLLAFDNVLLPVYVLFFDITSDDGQLTPREAREISMGLWAHVRDAALASRFLAVFQTTGSRGGPSFAVKLFDRTTLADVATVRESISGEDRGHVVDRLMASGLDRNAAFRWMPGWNGICTIGDILFIATLGRGLGWVDLEAALPDPLPPSRELDNRLALALAWTNIFGENIFGLVPAPGGRGAFVLACEPGGEPKVHWVDPLDRANWPRHPGPPL